MVAVPVRDGDARALMLPVADTVCVDVCDLEAAEVALFDLDDDGLGPVHSITTRPEPPQDPDHGRAPAFTPAM